MSEVKLCKRGHPQTAENRVFFPSLPYGCCRLCREDNNWLYKEAHRAEATAAMRAWRARNVERERARARDYYQRKKLREASR